MQGVSYRANTQDQARRLGVLGWVRNLPNGDVEAVAEAEPEVVERFVSWCREGPSEARVAAVVVTDENPDAPFSSFEVRR